MNKLIQLSHFYTSHQMVYVERILTNQTRVTVISILSGFFLLKNQRNLRFFSCFR